jgi:hypothetical protein
MQIQLSRLFGESSAIAKHGTDDKSLRRTFKFVLREIEQYVDANVDTDELHRIMLQSGLYAANEALKEDDFWVAYVEGITRFALTLLGDYPDQRKRKPGRKNADHYKLDRLRTAGWTQNIEQRFRVLIYVGDLGFPELSRRPWDVLMEFQTRYGYNTSHARFMNWYRKNFSEDYVKVFS